MAKDNEKELSILDMDFGDFLSPDDNHLTPPIPKTPEEEAAEEAAALAAKEEEEKEKLDLEAALAANVAEDDTDDKDGETQDKEIKDKSGPPVSSDDEPFTLVLARYQLEQGVLSSLDEEKLQEIIEKEGEGAAFTYLIQNEVESNSKEVADKLDDYTKEYAELRKSGFASEDAGSALLTLESLDSITEEDLKDEDKEELRRTILKENYKATTSFSESKIDRLVKRAFDINVDVDDAQEALESLREAKKQELVDAKAAQKKSQEDAQTAYNAQIQELGKHIDELEEIIPGKKINKQTKSKIKDIITKPVKQSEDGYAMNAMWAKRHEDPAAFDTVLSYLYLSGVFEGKWDQITKSVNTKLTNRLEDKLKSGSGSSLLGGKHTINRTPGEAAREDLIGPMKHLFGQED